MTGGMSGTVRSAEAAAEMSETKVTVIDSMFISHALSFQVLEAAKMAANGKTLEEIVTRIEQVRKQTTLFVVVDKLDNLVKGGRIGRRSRTNWFTIKNQTNRHIAKWCFIHQ